MRSDMIRHALCYGGSRACSPKTNFKRCNLVRFGVYFDQILSSNFFFKLPFFYRKNIYIMATRLLCDIELMDILLKTSYNGCILVYIWKKF